MKDPLKATLQHARHMGVLQTLANALPYVSDTERRLVTRILAQPKEASTMAVPDLANHAGVREATAFRLCRDLGSSGFGALRRGPAEAVAAVGESVCAPVEAGYKTGSEAVSILRGAYVGMRMLLDAAALPRQRIDAAVHAINKPPSEYRRYGCDLREARRNRPVPLPAPGAHTHLSLARKPRPVHGVSGASCRQLRSGAADGPAAGAATARRRRPEGTPDPGR